MTPPLSSLTSVPVLVVEPLEGSRALYADALRIAGCRVTVVSDSERAYVMAIRRPPRVVIASFEAPFRDERFAICQRFREDERTRHIPVVIVAAALDQADIARATAMGALAVAAHPTDAAKLIGAVQGVLAARPGQRIKARLRPPDDIKRSA